MGLGEAHDPDAGAEALLGMGFGAQDQIHQGRRVGTDLLGHAPQFGGYCAYALSKGSLAPSVPEAWTLHRDQLFLNASLRARELWLEDMEANIAKAREYWPGILG